MNTKITGVKKLFIITSLLIFLSYAHSIVAMQAIDAAAAVPAQQAKRPFFRRQKITYQEVRPFFDSFNHTNIFKEKISIVEHMLQKISINAVVKDIYSQPSLLLLSVLTGNVEFACFIIERGASLPKNDKYNRTPLIEAADEAGTKKLPIVHALIQHGANINKADKEGFTPLMHAIGRCSYETAIVLIINGANVNMKTRSRGYNALMMAIERNEQENSDELVATLILSGAQCSKAQYSDIRTFSDTTKKIIKAAQKAKIDLDEQDWLPANFIATSQQNMLLDRQELNLRELVGEYASPYHEVPAIQQAIINEIHRRQVQKHNQQKNLVKKKKRT